jgi:hypothetical protein
VQLPIATIFNILVANQVTTIDQLWSVLTAGASLQQKNDYAAIFAEHGVGADDLQITAGGQPTVTLSASDAAPTFEWQIPQGSGSVGDVMAENKFGIRIYNQQDNVVFDSGILAVAVLAIDNNRKAKWTPTINEWNTIKANIGTNRFVVYGQPTEGVFTTVLLSEWLEFAIVP